jgi:hypothetical protein
VRISRHTRRRTARLRFDRHAARKRGTGSAGASRSIINRLAYWVVCSSGAMTVLGLRNSSLEMALKKHLLTMRAVSVSSTSASAEG